MTCCKMSHTDLDFVPASSLRLVAGSSVPSTRSTLPVQPESFHSTVPFFCVGVSRYIVYCTF